MTREFRVALKTQTNENCQMNLRRKGTFYNVTKTETKKLEIEKRVNIKSHKNFIVLPSEKTRLSRDRFKVP